MDVLPEYTYICELSPVHFALRIDLMVHVISVDFIESRSDVIGKVVNPLKLLNHFFCTKAYAACIDIDASLNPSATRCLHTSPIFERV